LNNATIRLRSAETALAQLLYTGASLTLRRLVVSSPSGFNHLFDAAEGVETLEMDGALVIEHCTVIGPVSGGLSYGAVVSLQGGNTTYGDNFTLSVRSNLFDCGGTSVRLPTGSANNASYVVENNLFTGRDFYIGSTQYSGLSAFQAAHSGAARNKSGAPLLTSKLRPQFRSVAKAAGKYSQEKDAAGENYLNPPTCGAYEVEKSGHFVQARLAILREQQLKLLQEQLEEDSEDVDS
jgi:hypothetical protein